MIPQQVAHVREDSFLPGSTFWGLPVQRPHHLLLRSDLKASSVERKLEASLPSNPRSLRCMYKMRVIRRRLMDKKKEELV
jgi:hypothetical protein